MKRILFYVLLLQACRDQKQKALYDPGKNYAGAVEPAEDKSEDAIKDGKKTPDESLVPPVQISGTYLRCQEFDSNISISVDLACRLEDDSETRVLPSQVAARVDYHRPVPLVAEVRAEVRVLDSNEDFDVVYTFHGTEFYQLKNVVKATDLRIDFIGLLSGEGAGFVSGRGLDVIAIVAKPWWIRELTSDSNRDGKCQAGESCRFESSELMWTRDDGLLYGYPGAQSLCDNLNDGFNDWRLPTDLELQLAFAKKIVALNSSDYLNLKAGRYWTETSASGNEKWIVDTETGMSSPREQSDAFGVLCVRPIHNLDGILY